jgi:hypothetical protein
MIAHSRTVPSSIISAWRHVTDSDAIVCIGWLCIGRQRRVLFGNQSPHPGLSQQLVLRRTVMKPPILGVLLLGIAFAPAAAEAKGCIKGAIIGGLAGHIAGHGKVGVVAGCIIGRHEANKRDAEKADQKAAPSQPRDGHI